MLLRIQVSFSHGATGFKQVGKRRKINELHKWLSRAGLRVYAPISLKMLRFFTVEKTMFVLGITFLNTVAQGEKDRGVTLRIINDLSSISARMGLSRHLRLEGLTIPANVDFPRFFRQHDRNALANRIGKPGGFADQLLRFAVIDERLFRHRADQNLQQCRIGFFSGVHCIHRIQP